MRKSKFKVTLIFSILVASFMAQTFAIIGPVNAADEDDVGIEEGEEHRWIITDVDTNEYPSYEIGDLLIVKVEKILFDEEYDTWVIYVLFLNFDEDPEEDKYQRSTNRIYNGNETGYGFSGNFIPDEDPKDFLEDVADSYWRYEVDGYKLEYNGSSTIITYKFNSDGILEEYELETHDGETLLEYEYTTEGVGVISYGPYFLILIPIGIIGCALIVRKKLRREKDEKI